MRIITLTKIEGRIKKNIVVDKIVMFGDNPNPINQYSTLMRIDDVVITVMESSEEIIELIRNAEVI